MPKCPKCGYKMLELFTQEGCPMCKLCEHCGRQLSTCNCREGE